jgi:hypothetical protein
MIHSIEIEIRDKPVIVRLYHWEPYKPAYTHGPPDRCYEAEGGYGDWAVFHLDGGRAVELEESMTPAEIEAVDEKFFSIMESER